MKLYRCNESFEADEFDHMGKWVFEGALFLVEQEEHLPGGIKRCNFFTEFLMQIPNVSPIETSTKDEKSNV